MASRILHIAACSQLEKSIPIKDVNRFRVGQILPDALIHSDKATFNTHFTKLVENGCRKYFDFFEFYDRYEKLILSDDLYLGYYFHLIEDAIFRIILYYDVGMIDKRNTDGFLQSLYNDYHILNGIFVKKYKLENNLYEPENFKNERINEIALFEVSEFINTMNSDFNDCTFGEAVHFTQHYAQKFIADSVKVCTAEFNAIKCNKHAVAPYDYFWENKTNAAEKKSMQ